MNSVRRKVYWWIYWYCSNHHNRVLNRISHWAEMKGELWHY